MLPLPLGEGWGEGDFDFFASFADIDLVLIFICIYLWIFQQLYEIRVDTAAVPTRSEIIQKIDNHIFVGSNSFEHG